MDAIYIFKWWLLLFVIGIAGFPLSGKIFGRFLDKGYGLSKILGVLVISYFAFLLSITKVLPLTQTLLIFYLSIYALLNLYIAVKNKNRFVTNIPKILPVLLFEEILFVFGLLLWAFVRGHQPDINGLEKFMDYGFVTSSAQALYLPPPDMWFSGQGINYYWFGHYTTGLLTKLSGIPSYITYNLMLATILGFSLSGAFSLVSTLIQTVLKPKTRKLALIGGFISAILLNFAGNFHTPYFIYQKGRDAYWYPDATRFIGYNPDVPDKTIHEFPMYSYVVADLHAHILNLPFVLLFISLLYISLPKENKSKVKKLTTIILGVLLGIMFMTNAWDFANYLLATGFVYLIYYLRKNGLNAGTIIKISVTVGTIMLIAVLASLPFILNFDSIAQGVKITHTKSPLWQLAILWGFPATLTLLFLTKLKSKVREDLFVFGLLAACWSLIALPEFIYVKDIYAETHYRANTMFKLTYQAFVISYLCSGYIAIRVLSGIKKPLVKGILCLFLILVFSSILHYGVISTKSYYADLKVYKGLNGEVWLRDKDPNLYGAIEWLRNNTTGQPIILEAPGDSYTEYNSVSSYTGFPTVSGWFVHEWLWRGSAEFPQERVNDITTIYNSKKSEEVQNLLRKYQVKYVLVGPYEREKFPELDESKFVQVAKRVFNAGDVSIYQVN